MGTCCYPNYLLSDTAEPALMSMPGRPLLHTTGLSCVGCCLLSFSLCAAFFFPPSSFHPGTQTPRQKRHTYFFWGRDLALRFGPNLHQRVCAGTGGLLPDPEVSPSSVSEPPLLLACRVGVGGAALMGAKRLVLFSVGLHTGRHKR